MKKDRTGIQSKEDLIRHYEAFEKLAFKRFKNIEVGSYEKIWELFVERNIKILDAPKEVRQEWSNISDDRKKEWIENLKTEHQDRGLDSSSRVK